MTSIEPQEEQPEQCEPTAEVAQMRAATPGDAQAVDGLILRECPVRFGKVAMVVAKVLREFDARFPHLPIAYIQARMLELEDGGLVEIAGDVWSMRHSEIHLLKGSGEANPSIEATSQRALRALCDAPHVKR